ncbi:protein of unknown function [Candidatus Nitrosotalea okcheonensis]|uniref:Uncharacterized protein n=1 Tax=Candidatus Nitrosotalea okcheonensis TaxID=1903276 RepID=A0A2H1FGE5_9ARCH|nr:protein of unknown function [Candidatus Nitrosotalea okcheonensis]
MQLLKFIFGVGTAKQLFDFIVEWCVGTFLKSCAKTFVVETEVIAITLTNKSNIVFIVFIRQA